jgi:hypothetical protein
MDQEPLLRLQKYLGGHIDRLIFRTPNRWSGQIGKPIWGWNVTGPRARGVMFTLFSMLSARRRDQIKDALKAR